MKLLTKIILFVIRAYRKILSPDHGIIRYIIPYNGACVMYPTCSVYMEQAIIKYGLTKGFYKGFRRVLRCHPYQKQYIDEP